jgi:hypothetical protein
LKLVELTLKTRQLTVARGAGGLLAQAVDARRAVADIG